MTLLHVADDYGIASSVDRAIVSLARRGGVDAVSVMVTALGDGGLDPLDGIPGVQIGLHLDLTHGAPACRPDEVPGLVDRDGRLLPLPRLVQRIVLGRVTGGELAREIDAQWGLLLRLAGRIDHLDGHQHVHLLPGVFAAICDRLEREPARRRVRFAPPAGGPLDIRRVFLGAAVWWHRHRARTGGRSMPFDWLPDLVDYDRLAAYGGGRRDTEVMLHVASPREGAPQLDRGSYDYRRRVEQFRRRSAEVTA